MGLVDDQERLVALGHLGQGLQRRAVAVHGIEALDHDPRPPLAALPPPGGYGRFERLGVVVRDAHAIGPAEPHAVVGAGVDQLVVDHEVAALGQGGQERPVGRIAAGKVEGGLRTEEGGGLGLQRLVLGIVAAQQPRTARADGHPPPQGRLDRAGQAGRAGQAEVVVGSEVAAAPGRQPPEPVAGGQRRELARMGVENGGGRGHAHPLPVRLRQRNRPCVCGQGVGFSGR